MDAAARPPITLRHTPREGGGVVIARARSRAPASSPPPRPGVFEPFFTTRRGGTGLGLAIARNIIDGLGGTIASRSSAPAGTDVRIDAAAVAAAGHGQGAHERRTERPMATGSVLIADDEEQHPAARSRRALRDEATT